MKTLTSKKISKTEFVRELNKIVDKLPRCYGVIVKTMLPHKSMTRIYQVKNMGVRDMEVLEAFKKICKSK